MSKYQVGYRFTVKNAGSLPPTEWEVVVREPMVGGGTFVRIHMSDAGFAAYERDLEAVAPELIESGLINNADVQLEEYPAGQPRIVGLVNSLELAAVREMYPGARV